MLLCFLVISDCLNIYEHRSSRTCHHNFGGSSFFEDPLDFEDADGLKDLKSLDTFTCTSQCHCQ